MINLWHREIVYSAVLKHKGGEYWRLDSFSRFSRVPRFSTWLEEQVHEINNKTNNQCVLISYFIEKL